MTCIVGLIDDGKIYIGGDSAGMNEAYDITVRTDPKVFQNGLFIMGFTDSFRMGQLLMYSLSISKQNKETDEQFMCTTFIDAVRKCLKKGGYASSKNGEEEGGEFLVGYKSTLYRICSDFQVGCSNRGYMAVGCGRNYAYGSLWETNDTKIKPEIRVLRALKCAEEFSAGVRSPFKVITGK
ncbi:hypothetical protein LCGC14_0834530 [marine sediment metagenome]|uniref:Proteasome endopeptidase complex n=1 Tax=marine sediment metagenome TaxID=412755 RepID=A0A0F9PF08_9ZZZZ